jgi:hypothetical protein
LQIIFIHHRPVKKPIRIQHIKGKVRDDLLRRIIFRETFGLVAALEEFFVVNGH